MDKKLYRSTTDKVLAGVCGGLGEYLDMDVTLLRLIWTLVVVFTGFVPGVLVYIIAAIVMPQKPGAASGEPTAKA
jgi:phage shock protein C